MFDRVSDYVSEHMPDFLMDSPKLSAFARNKDMVEKFGGTYDKKKHAQYVSLIEENGGTAFSVEKVIEVAEEALVATNFGGDIDSPSQQAIGWVKAQVYYLNKAATTNLEVECLYDVTPTLSNGLRIGRFEITNKMKLA